MFYILLLPTTSLSFICARLFYDDASRVHVFLYRPPTLSWQLGLGATSTCLTPTHNPFLSDGEGGVVSVSAGANHSVCAVASGLVLGWGHAEYNQQGVAGARGVFLLLHMHIFCGDRCYQETYLEENRATHHGEIAILSPCSALPWNFCFCFCGNPNLPSYI